MAVSENRSLIRLADRAVEKAEPGTKRILVSIVAETLSLARAKTPIQPVPHLRREEKFELEEWNRKGNEYYDGAGVPQDYVEAVKWYRQAAERGFAPSQFNLAHCYARGLGVAPDYFNQAKKWCLKAAELGHAVAQWAYYQYSHDSLVPNKEEAARWLTKSAEQGYTTAQIMLGGHYQGGGWGVPQDHAQAATWYRKAVERGSVSTGSYLEYCYSQSPGSILEHHLVVPQFIAYVKLGRCYRDGKGVPKDEIEAYKWYQLGLDSEPRESKDVTLLKAKLNPTELAEGQRRYEEFKRRMSNSQERP